jgi:beta-lactamase class A
VKPGRKRVILQQISWMFLGASVLLFTGQIIRYGRLWNNFQPGTVIASVPVDGLSRAQAAERLAEVYNAPVELQYHGAAIQVEPARMGFKLDEKTMLDAAEAQRTDQPFWSSFWAFLWGSSPRLKEIPLSAVVSEERIRQYLQNEIAPRYDQPPTPMMPIPGSIGFVPGVPGTVLNIQDSVLTVEKALHSPSDRTAILYFDSPSVLRPSFSILVTMLKQIIHVDGFDGVTEIYLKDLKSGEEFDFGYKNGEDLPPDIAYTAASTMKIPIMVTVFRRVGEPAPQSIADQLEHVFRYSENPPADRLLQTVVDRNLGPLSVTSDLQVLGLKNTFLAGYFYPGAPLLRRIITPANSRTDVTTSPDVYNQTTAADMGMILEDIYECAESGGGTFAAVFDGEISQSECKQMVSYLELDRIGVLIQGGIPDGGRIAHKHGWIVESDGYIHTVGDSAIIYSPGGDYILSIFMNHPNQLVWDSANLLFARLSQAVYNYYNPGNYWGNPGK